MSYAIAHLSRSALLHNFQRVKASTSAKVVAVIKANAYGHGVLEAAEVLQEAEVFAVARLQEAIELRAQWPDKPILLLEGVSDIEAWQCCGEHHFDAVVHCQDQILQLAQAVMVAPIAVWLKVDTGMHRLGFPLGQTEHAIEQLSSLPCIKSVKLMTHFCCADDVASPMTGQQLLVFNGIPFEGECSMANSAAILSRPDASKQWVRPGIMLYGSSPFTGKSGPDDDLQAVMTLHTKLISIQSLAKGDAVGYSGTYVCPEDMKIGVAAVGYADGYPRHAPSGTPVMVDGNLAALVGRVSMDMITIDLRQVPNAVVGSVVELWGSNLSADLVADAAGTIAYDLFCGVTPRVPKIWGD
ncbi:MAG: alanine racemase [Methylococcales bacterium]|jgi:alanine racemase|nr:alanine racemase [Methylococcales bacterium]MBT7442926.1 alanine racemase [Methylococcales bacterium]